MSQGSCNHSGISVIHLVREPGFGALFGLLDFCFIKAFGFDHLVGHDVDALGVHFDKNPTHGLAVVPSLVADENRFRSVAISTRANVLGVAGREAVRALVRTARGERRI